MAISVFDLFSIGIGPSSSHTVGPMRAAKRFLQEIGKEKIENAVRVKVDLYGSLALTGKGHATDLAVMLGLQGETPEDVDPNSVQEKIHKIRETKKIHLMHQKWIDFHEESDLLFHYDKQLPYHPNGMRFTLYNHDENELVQKVFYSVGGGFIVDLHDAKDDIHLGDNSHGLLYPFKNAAQLLANGKLYNKTIQEMMFENELRWRSADEIKKQLLKIWHVMEQSIERGCSQDGVLPGGLNVKRRAAPILRSLREREKLGLFLPTDIFEWVSLWALAVNEENAAAGRIVTAPTNGSSGVIPAVIKYYRTFVEGANDEGVMTILLVAGAIGILYKEGASISAAEMGCMGEVGVACSMAAAGLTAVMGGTNEQMANAAEIGMEHNLGLTCDPIKGLVQIPCIERNTMGAIKAINASLLALRGDGMHKVSLDQVIETMRQTGNDMKSIYKETSQGGLAVNVPEC
ncbi:L-serine dehydratase 1 [Candidatus Rubidus massiliensis]|nr:L-serine dehydratase 1 [Candidatus Rubidus massiliensis]